MTPILFYRNPESYKYKIILKTAGGWADKLAQKTQVLRFR
jgi:hypothetical protein